MQSKIPTLEVWDISDDPIDVCVGIDHVGAGRDMGEHLLALGYCRPAYVGVATGRDPRAETRFRGLSDAFAALGRPFVNNTRVNGPSSFETGRDGCALALDCEGETPDVVCFLNDHLAFGGLMECAARGLDVPKDMGIVGFNDLGINTVLPQRLTTSKTPRTLIGTTGAKLLIAALRGVRNDRTIELPVKIVAGETTTHRA